MKKRLTILLCVFLCLALSSCSLTQVIADELRGALSGLGGEAPPETFATVAPITGTPASYTPIECRLSYNALSDEDERELYMQLLQAISAVDDEPDDNGRWRTERVECTDTVISERSIRTVIKAIYDDNPQIFWLDDTYGQLIDTDNNRTIVQMYSRYSPETIRQMNAEISSALSALFDLIPSGLDEYGVEKYVHDYLLDTCEYDKDVSDDAAYTDAHREIYMPYGALVGHKAVCEGYSRAMQLILNRLGIECACICGDGDGDLHMWNSVKIDSDWYSVDLTWDDQEDTILRYEYFNVTDEVMSENHTPSKMADEMTDAEVAEDYVYMNLFIPECTDIAYNYYVYECPHLSDYSGEDLKNAMYYAALERKEYLSFYIDPETLYYDDAVKDLFSRYPQYYFDYLETVNGWLTDISIDSSNVAYYQNKKLSVVTLSLSYV